MMDIKILNNLSSMESILAELRIKEEVEFFENYKIENMEEKIKFIF